jgi:hypothetical protein
MPYQTLGELRSALSSRLGFGAQGSSGINSGILDSFLQSAQDQLWLRADWRNLITYDEKTTGIGQTLYDWAANCDQNRPLREIAVYDGATWVPMSEGITFAMRTDNSQTIPARFERYAQMEIWPAPDAAYTIRRYYVATCSRFTQDSDRASIDDGMIFLHALAAAKAHYKQADAEIYSQQLSLALEKLRAQARGQAVFSRRDVDDVYLARPRDA